MPLCVEFLDASEPLPIDLEKAEIRLPYFTSAAIMGLGSFFGGRACVASARNTDGTLLAVAVYFIVKSEKIAVGVSRGRYGFLGIQALNGLSAIDLSEFVHALKVKVRQEGGASLSICLEPISFRKIGLEMLPACDIPDQCAIFLCDLAEIFDDSGGFVFRKYRKRGSLSRGLRLGRGEGFWAEPSTDIEELRQWHERCHLARSIEQESRVWPWKTFESLSRNTTWVLHLVRGRNGNMAGGCFSIHSRDVMELFMMSTPHDYLARGANYILTEFIYKDAFSRKVKYINWQASNPPTGGVADYKMKWGAKRIPVYTLNYVFDDAMMAKLSPDKLHNMFGEHFVIPYRWFENH